MTERERVAKIFEGTLYDGLGGEAQPHEKAVRTADALLKDLWYYEIVNAIELIVDKVNEKSKGR